MYTNYSMWDTYRAEHALLTLIAPQRVDGMMNALLNAYREGGWLPKWPNPGYTGQMVGGCAEMLLAEAWAKGFRGFDVRVDWRAVQAGDVHGDRAESGKGELRRDVREAERRGARGTPHPTGRHREGRHAGI